MCIHSILYLLSFPHRLITQETQYGLPFIIGSSLMTKPTWIPKTWQNAKKLQRIPGSTQVFLVLAKYDLVGVTAFATFSLWTWFFICSLVSQLQFLVSLLCTWKLSREGTMGPELCWFYYVSSYYPFPSLFSLSPLSFLHHGTFENWKPRNLTGLPIFIVYLQGKTLSFDIFRVTFAITIIMQRWK